jgi:hypothetical protein
MSRGVRVIRRRRLLRAAAVGGMARPPASPGADTQVTIEALEELSALHERRVIRDEELAERKRRLPRG